jgi:hypothetical protein
MISQTRIVLFIMVAVTIAFLGMSNAAVYKWQDPEGNMHFTDDLTKVPPDYRDRMNVEEDLPEEPVNVTPAPQASEPPSTPPSTQPPAAEPESSLTYAGCQKRVDEQRKQLSDQLTQDQERLVEINRLIHRSTTSRVKNEYQRERVAVEERIEQTEEMLHDKLPPLEEECERIRYWQGEE